MAVLPLRSRLRRACPIRLGSGVDVLLLRVHRRPRRRAGSDGPSSADSSGRGREVIAVLGVLLAAAAVYVAWWYGRRQARESPASTKVSDDELRVLRLLAENGPIEEAYEVPKDASGVRRTYAIGRILIDGGDPANEWVRTALRDLENAGLIGSTDLGRWPSPGPRKSWITDAGRAVVRTTERRQVPERTIVAGRRPGGG